MILLHLICCVTEHSEWLQRAIAMMFLCITVNDTTIQHIIYLRVLTCNGPSPSCIIDEPRLIDRLKIVPFYYHSSQMKFASAFASSLLFLLVLVVGKDIAITLDSDSYNAFVESHDDVFVKLFSPV